MSKDQLSTTIEQRIDNIEKSVLAVAQLAQANLQALMQLRDLVLGFQTVQLQRSHPNPLNAFGAKCFSQTDEDEITLEIIRRLGIEIGVFAEFGVGNGLENNTLILAALNWKGFWVGGEDLAFQYNSSKFRYVKAWITLDNILIHAQSCLESLGSKKLDVVSIDLDGNDIYFVEKLLSNNICPSLFIVEYNAKFIPPTKFQIAYNPTHRWAGDDYFGAALTNFVELFSTYGYELICCNSHTGANAFFIKRVFRPLFSDVPTCISDIYVGPRYHLYHNFGHKISAKVIERILSQ